MGGVTSYGTSGDKNKAYAVIKTTGEVWVAVNKTAAIPVGATFALATSELVSVSEAKIYLVNVGDVLNFFAKGGTTPSISVAFYPLPG